MLRRNLLKLLLQKLIAGNPFYLLNFSSYQHKSNSLQAALPRIEGNVIDLMNSVLSFRGALATCLRPNAQAGENFFIKGDVVENFHFFLAGRQKQVMYN